MLYYIGYTNYQKVKSFTSPGNHLCGLGWDGTSLWHSDGEMKEIYRLDPKTGKILKKIKIDSVRTDLDVDDSEIWQVAGEEKQIYVINKTDGTIKKRIKIEENSKNACAIYLDEDFYMIGYKDTGKIEKRQRKTHELISELEGSPEIGGIGILNDKLWYSTYEPGKIFGIDLKTSKLIYEFQVDGNPTGLCVDETMIWYCDYKNNEIVGIIPLD